ncbi:hypothetical protein ACFLRF_02975 [Candidatus Altiarchaeota archaeon]
MIRCVVTVLALVSLAACIGEDAMEAGDNSSIFHAGVNQTTLQDDGGREPVFRDLAFTNQNRVFISSYVEAEKAYNITIEAEVEGNIKGLDIINDWIVVSMESGNRSGPDSITIMDDKLRTRANKPFGNVGSINAEGDYIYAGVNNSFMKLNGALEVVDSVELNSSWGRWKVVHDILLHEGRAYLLDNVMMPIYVFIVNDTEDGMSLDVSYEILGINQHLMGQWIDTVNGLWIILQSESHKAGGEQTALIMDRHGKHKGRHRYYSYSRLDDKVEGVMIAKTTGIDPAWAVTVINNTCSLARIGYDDGKIRITNELLLDDKTTRLIYPETINFRMADGLIYATIYSRLFIIRPGDEPQILHEQMIEPAEWMIQDMMVLG